MTDETKTCPFCAETIKTAAIKCKHCGSSLAPTEGDDGKAPAAPTPAEATPPTGVLDGPISKKPLVIVAGIGGGLLLAVMVVVFANDSCQGCLTRSDPGGSKSGGSPSQSLPPINVIGVGVATLSDWKHDGVPSHLKAKLCAKPGARIKKVEYVVYSGETVLKQDDMVFSAVSGGGCVKATLWWNSSDKPTKIGVVVRGTLPPRKGALPRICQAIIDCCDNTLRYFHGIKRQLNDDCRGHFVLLCSSAWKSSAATSAECKKYIRSFTKDCGKWIPSTAPECRGGVSRSAGQPAMPKPKWEYTFSAFELLGWSPDGTKIVRARKATLHGKTITVVSFCRFGSTPACTSIPTTGASPSMPAIKSLKLSAPGPSATVYRRWYEHNNRTKAKLKARIPGTSIAVRLGKWTGNKTKTPCHPLFVAGKKIICIPSGADGLSLAVHLRKNGKAVAIGATIYHESSMEQQMFALPLAR